MGRAQCRGHLYESELTLHLSAPTDQRAAWCSWLLHRNKSGGKLTLHFSAKQGEANTESTK
jgi:hypothetical protein